MGTLEVRMAATDQFRNGAYWLREGARTIVLWADGWVANGCAMGMTEAGHPRRRIASDHGGLTLSSTSSVAWGDSEIELFSLCSMASVGGPR